jgi:F-type H+-transporting ATPase subunit gamma
MASGKEIRTKIVSVKNTQKITRAMEMVAASKMRRAQERMEHSRPYATKIHQVINHLAYAHSEYKHPYMNAREEVKRVGVIIVSSDRGLCGGLNTNLFKTTVSSMKEWNDQGFEIDVSTIGNKAAGFFRRLKTNIIGQVSDLGDRPKLEDIIGTVKVMLDKYNEGKIDKLFIIYNKFINTMTQKQTVEQIIPITPAEKDETLNHRWDYIYEPSATEVLDALLMRYIESLVYQAIVENIACEQSARMVAMKSASDNAGNLIDELQLAYNKARQAAITQELSEIVGGAAAV